MADQPPIAERVRFWEEQDRINKVLIPRVLKLHERLSTLEQRDLGISSLLGALEARLAANGKSQVDVLRTELGARIAHLERRFTILIGLFILVGSVTAAAVVTALLK
jgi:hypothetical protein